MTLQLAIDDHLAQEARKVAESRGMSVEQLVLDFLERLTSEQSLDEEMAELRRLSTAAQFKAELQRLSAEGKGHSKGWKFNRDEIHERS